MTIYAGNTTLPNDFVNQYPTNSVERKVIEILSSSNQVYRYQSLDHFKFELELRANVVSASRELFYSGLSFRTFRRSVCNPAYWNRDEDGGFSTKEGVPPSEAIRDIFRNGSRYGTECATAIVIVYFKAVLNVFPDEIFNRLFPRINLMNWQNLDNNLGISYFRNPIDYLPGDCRYVRNPDVNPSTPEWQGENAIDLGNGFYYGHGIGIKTIDGIIAALNQNRRPGATESAYLMNSVNRLDFVRLASLYNRFVSV
ncbi:protein-glutamine gamma-glutamyltransferase [Geosporobacter ferrireducens]|uniref:Protein-glutamine gamma-glutamyltransferase n=1 Tax=Geosporobacter ferrireducens TaxID=1424294 RepID=A0A1D8GDQ5_9FIRM|nr:protein-glutamine gamma-glutamyltransferase [Geosporobacter ferrireducens]AOT69050.1 protein-glutamine gamma-glutamyltransferase [Geosporobacter ferrireducens]